MYMTEFAYSELVELVSAYRELMYAVGVEGTDCAVRVQQADNKNNPEWPSYLPVRAKHLLHRDSAIVFLNGHICDRIHKLHH